MAKKTPLLVTRKMIDKRIEKIELLHDDIPDLVNIQPLYYNIFKWNTQTSQFGYVFFDESLSFAPLFNFTCEMNVEKEIHLYYYNKYYSDNDPICGEISFIINFINNSEIGSLSTFFASCSTMHLYSGQGEFFPNSSNLYVIQIKDENNPLLIKYYFAMGTVSETCFVRDTERNNKFNFCCQYNFDLL